MNTIQTNVSDEALVTAIRANMCDFFRRISRVNPEEHLENGQFTRWYIPLPQPWVTGALYSNLPKGGDDPFIDETIQYFRDKKVNTFTWWMEPHLKPSGWESLLSKHGFSFSNDTPGMAIDLHEMNESMQAVDGFEIHEVNTEESLRIWARIFVNGYGNPPDWESIITDLWIKLGLDLPVRNYLGYLNGKPVATSTIFYGGGAAGIYFVATLPEARGKGIVAAINLKPLQDARTLGYRVGALQSSNMGFSVYKKLGLRHRFQIYNFYYSL